MASKLGFLGNGAKPPAKACPKPCPRPCADMPAVPEQGGVMPVLWQPEVSTDFATNPTGKAPTFTLNLITTQWIDKGVRLNLQVWNGVLLTYADAAAAGPGALTSLDYIITAPIPPATVLVVSITPTSTAIYGYTGSKQYSNIGPGAPTGFSRFSSCICFAFAPTTTGAWIPARGQPQFAIGFNYFDAATNPDHLQGCTLTSDPTNPTPTAASATAPNFPDQFLKHVQPTAETWVFLYSVVYPAMQRFNLPDNVDCSSVVGIKFQYGIHTYSRGSWSSLRDVITQPYTVHRDNYESVTHWYPYSSIPGYIGEDTVTANVGPFSFAAMAGQLVVVYFRPLPQEVATDDSPILGYDAAEIGLLVTAPIPPRSTIYFTTDAFDTAHSGFGPRDVTGTGLFIDTEPSFHWVTGSNEVPAGTVVFISGIGTPLVTIQDAHSIVNVGNIVYNTVTGRSVVSVIVLGAWTTPGIGSARPIDASQFVTAALSNQYAGDYPSLAPCVTINKNLFFGPEIYGQGQLFDNAGLPGTVQAPMINSAQFKLLPDNTIVDPATLPSFINMAGFHF
jgi:hypothetical protein